MSDDTTWSSFFEIFFPDEIWGPMSNVFSSGLQNVTLAATVIAIAYIMMLYIEKTKEIPGAWNPWVIFWILVLNFVVILFIAWWMSPITFFGTEVLSAAPNSCIGTEPGQFGSLEGGLCYPNCKKGYHGLGVRCYADTVNIGPGTVIGLEPCPDGWTTTFLMCFEPINWCGKNPMPGICLPTGGRAIGRAIPGVCPGPQDFGNGEIRVDGKWDNDYKQWKASNDKGDPAFDPVTNEVESIDSATKSGHKQCADVAATTGKHTERIDGMCYKKCPADKPEHVPGMPYLCYKGGDLSYPRDAGRVPPAFRLLNRYAINVPPHAPVDNTPT